MMSLPGTTEEKLARMRALLAASETGMKGLDEIETLFGLIAEAGITKRYDNTGELEDCLSEIQCDIINCL